MRKLMTFLGAVVLYFDVLTRCRFDILCKISQDWAFEEPEPVARGTTSSDAQVFYFTWKA